MVTLMAEFIYSVLRYRLCPQRLQHEYHRRQQLLRLRCPVLLLPRPRPARMLLLLAVLVYRSNLLAYPSCHAFQALYPRTLRKPM